MISASASPTRAEVIGQGAGDLVWSDGTDSFIDAGTAAAVIVPVPLAEASPTCLAWVNIQRPHVSYGPHSFELRSFKLCRRLCLSAYLERWA